MTPISAILHLPEVVLTNIFKFLSLKDIYSLMLTCKTLNKLIFRDNDLWKSMAQQPLQFDREYRKNPSYMIRHTRANKGFVGMRWYKNCRAAYNWCHGYYKSKNILSHRINYMPWIKLHNSEVLLITVGSYLHCYSVRNGIPNGNKLLWKLEVPQVVTNDIRTNDISRFMLNGDSLICGNRDGSTAVYKVTNVRTQPVLMEHITNCHEDGQVGVSAVEVVRNGGNSLVVTGSDDSSNIQFWHQDEKKEFAEDCQPKFKSYKEIALDKSLGVRSLAVSEQNNKLAVGPDGNSWPLLIDTNTGQVILSNYEHMNKNQAVRDILWHKEHIVIYVTHSGHLNLLDVRNNKTVYNTVDPFYSTLYCVQTDGQRAFVTGSAEYSRCVLYDFCSPKHVQMFFTHQRSSPVYSLDFNPTTLVTAVDRAVAALNFDILSCNSLQRDHHYVFKTC